MPSNVVMFPFLKFNAAQIDVPNVPTSLKELLETELSLTLTDSWWIRLQAASANMGDIFVCDSAGGRGAVLDAGQSLELNVLLSQIYVEASINGEDLHVLCAASRSTIPDPDVITVTIGDDGAGTYGFEYSGGSYEYGDSDPEAPIELDAETILGIRWSEFGLSIECETSAAALKAAYTRVEIETVGGGSFISVAMADASPGGTSLFLGNTAAIQALAWDTLSAQDRIVRLIP